MSLLTSQQLGMDFAGDILFSDASFTIYPRDKVGLIGRNGSGKTTLFHLLRGQLEPTHGQVFRARNAKIGYLEQHACADSQLTVYDELLRVFQPLMDLEADLEQIAETIEQTHGTIEELLHRQSQLQQQFADAGGLTFRSRARATLLGLGFSEDRFLQPCTQLSGGQRSKLSLGKLLLSGADLLLLDEPTNHLDIPSVEWLESFVREFSGSCVIISHDRYFLDQVTQKTLEIFRQKITLWNGNYSSYLAQKAERDLLLQRHYEDDMKEVRRIEGIIEQQRRWGQERNFITAESKRKQLEKKRATIEVPEQAEKGIHFQFQPRQRSGNEVLQLDGLSKSFGEVTLFANADLQLFLQDRAFLLGPNGCGKTTLLRIIAGVHKADHGQVRFGANVQYGYFSQDLGGLHPEKTVLDEIWDDYRDMTQTQVRNALAAFLFTGDDVYKQVEKLSGGEKAKLALLKILLSGANLLLLDEPTNHLDIASREALEQALLDFPGTMLVVSHDRYFIQKLQTKIIQMRPDGLHLFVYGYEDYVGKMAQQQAVTKAVKLKKFTPYHLRKQQESSLRKARTRLQRCEAEIATQETEITALQQTLSLPETATDYERLMELSTQLQSLEDTHLSLLTEWEALQEQIAQLEENLQQREEDAP